MLLQLGFETINNNKIYRPRDLVSACLTDGHLADRINVYKTALSQAFDRYGTPAYKTAIFKRWQVASIPRSVGRSVFLSICRSVFRTRFTLIKQMVLSI